MKTSERSNNRKYLVQKGGGRVVRWSCVNFQCRGVLQFGGGSGCARVLGKLPVPGRPTIWITVGQGPTALAGGGWGLFGHFYSQLSFLSSFSLSLGDGPI